MACPRCGAEPPAWANHCTRCGELLGLPPPQPPPVPAEVAPPVVVEAGPPKDYRAYVTIGALLALASTLLLPPLMGPIAMWLGWKAHRNAPDPALRRRGLYVIVAGAAGAVLGTAITLWIDTTGLLR